MKKNIIKSLNLGETFTRKSGILPSAYYSDYKTLFEAYDRPSYTKEQIYNKYEKMLHENADSVQAYGVRSYNTFMFTIHAEIVKDGQRYYIYITPSYNYFIEI